MELKQRVYLYEVFFQKNMPNDRCHYGYWVYEKDKERAIRIARLLFMSDHPNCKFHFENAYPIHDETLDNMLHHS